MSTDIISYNLVIQFDLQEFKHQLTLTVIHSSRAITLSKHANLLLNKVFTSSREKNKISVIIHKLMDKSCNTLNFFTYNNNNNNL